MNHQEILIKFEHHKYYFSRGKVIQIWKYRKVN